MPALPDDVLRLPLLGRVAAGLGEIGWSKVFMTKKFGPRQRIHAIITDPGID